MDPPMLMGFSAFIWEIRQAQRKRNGMIESNEPAHRKVFNRLAIFSTIFPNLMANHSDHLAYQKSIECQIMMQTYWKNVNYYCINIEYDRISFAGTEKQWSEYPKNIRAQSEIWKLMILNENQINWPHFSIFFLFAVFCSESAKMDSKPTSWPRSRMESHLTKTSREKRKLQSSSPSSRNHPSSVGRMKRFQKSSAIYTLPIRGKQHNGTHCITGKSIN